MGSILEWSDTMTYVCGAGLISSDSILRYVPKEINCVRGPLTDFFLQRQGIPAIGSYGDPGILAPSFFSFKRSVTSEFAIIPHYVDKDSQWIKDCQQKGITIIDPLDTLENYFESLQCCDVILSSSLHGIIFAHAFGKKALWIDISGNVLGHGFKFFDYYLSIGISPEKVVRHQMHAQSDPYEFIKFATSGHHDDLLISLENSIFKTINQLNDCEYGIQ